MTDCAFCRIVNGDFNRPEKFVDWGDIVSFEPLNPHAPGHMLFVPKTHLQDATDNIALAEQVFGQAALYAFKMPAVNIITSKGAAATQTVFHLHIHVIPRDEHDGLPEQWPWLKEGE
jgi:histidine triad (HIT) family protein